MAILYFLLDICFYNYTFLKTNFLLLSIFDKKTKLFNILIYLLIDLLLSCHGFIFLLFTIFIFINSKIKIRNKIIRFIFFYLIYSLIVVIKNF